MIKRPPNFYTHRRPQVYTEVFTYRPTMEETEKRTRTTICHYTLTIPGSFWYRTRFPPIVFNKYFYPPTRRGTEYYFTPSTVQTESQTVEEARYSDEEKETTLRFKIRQPGMMYEILTERARTTAIYTFLYDNTDYDVWTPSSVFTEVVSLPVSGMIGEEPLPRTKFFYYTKDFADYEVFTRSTFEEGGYTLPGKEIAILYKGPIIQEFTRRPKPRPIITDHRTITKVYYDVVPVQEETYTDSDEEITIIMEIIEQKPKDDTMFKPEPITRIIEYRLTGEVFTESMAPFTYETVKFTFPSTYVPGMMRPQPTEVEVYTPGEDYYTDSIDKTTIMYDSWSVPEKPEFYTKQRPKIEVIVYEPQSDGYEVVKTPTTVKTAHFTIPYYSEVRTKSDLTMIIVILELPEKEVRTKMPDVISEITVFRPESWTYSEYQTPTTAEESWFTFPTKIIQNTRKPSRTTIYRYEFPEREREEEITPTDVEEFTFEPTGTYTIERRPGRTKIINKWPTKQPYTEYYAPSTTGLIWYTVRKETYTQHKKPPPTKKYKITPETIEETYSEAEPTTQYEEYSEPAREYTCFYPTPGSVVKSCKEHKRNCNEYELWRWKNKIRICVFDELGKKNKGIDDFITNPKGSNFKHLEEIVIACIKKIGDTPCRNKTFNLVEWILEKNMTAVGGYGEREKNYNPAEDFSFNVKKCVTLIQEAQMMQCYPGLHQVLTDIVLYRKDTVTLELLTPQPHRCLLLSLRHCNLQARQTLEKILQLTFRTCTKLTNSYEKSICKPGDKVEPDGEEYDLIECHIDKVMAFVEEMKRCVKSDEEGCSVEDFIKKFYTCVNARPLTCIVTFWQTAHPIYEYFIEIIKKMKADTCTKALASTHFKRCLQDMFSLAPYLGDFNNIERATFPVLQCIRYEARFCSPEVIRYILKSVKIFFRLNPTDAQDEPPDYGGFGVTIDSITVSYDSIGICEHVFRDRPDDYISRPTFEDECLPVNDNRVRRGTNFYLIKACTESKVDKWIQRVRSCLDDKVTQIGLKNPEFLTLNRVVSSMKTCIYESGMLGCSAKHLPDFTQIFKAVLDMVKQNSLSSKQNECRDKLRIERQSRCTIALHKYLVLSSKSERVETNRNKASQCLDSTIPGCSEVVKELLDNLVLAMVPNEMNIQNNLQVCDLNGQSAGQSGMAMDYDENRMECPGGIRVLKKRDLNDLEYGKSSYSNGKVINSENIEVSETVKEYQEWNPECSHQDYVHYFQKLTKCRDWKLAYQFPGKKDKCSLSIMKESWIAMIECLVEQDDSVLSCNITSRQLLDKFLNHVSEALNSNQPSNDTDCLTSAWCYGKHPPILNRCIDSYQQLLHTETTSRDIFLNIFNITKDVVHCLSSIWPGCPTTVPIMSLPFIYIPLGLHSVVTKDLNFTMCTKLSVENFPRDPQCFHDYGENKTGSHQVVKDLEECKACIRPKRAICFFNNVTDTLESTNQDFMYMYQCFSNYKATDECIHDVTTRATNNCLPLFYQCSESIQDGSISKMLQSCWKFHKCLQHFHKNCPDEFQTFIPDVYYDILGLNSAFQKLRIAF